MQCETCGKLIREGKRVKLEGSIVVTCSECAAYGVVLGDVVKQEPRKAKPKVEPAPVAESAPLFVETQTVVEDYGKRIHDARQKLNLKQEDLAKSLNEPVSLVHRLEANRFEPGNVLIKKLEHKLNIKLVEKTNSLEPGLLRKSSSKDLTLGDVVVVKKKK